MTIFFGCMLVLALLTMGSVNVKTDGDWSIVFVAVALFIYGGLTAISLALIYAMLLTEGVVAP